LLKESDTPELQVFVLKLLATSLKKADKADELKTLTARIGKLEEQLDQAFEKKAVPFKVAPFKGRKGKSDRVAVVELFTGAQCPPCVAADVAFDAARQAYQPKDVVLLQYHLHIPRPDPLTNADTEARATYYGDDKIEGTPTVLIDGAVTKEPLGGSPFQGEENFGKLQKFVSEELEKEAGARVKLKAERKGDQLDISAEVSDVKEPGPKVRLRLILVEEVVRYAGSNGQRLHHHVVRAFPGGVQGIKVEKNSLTHKETVDVGELRKKLTSYLSEYAKKDADLDEERPLDLKKFKVVALVQNDMGQKILQAAQVDLGE